MEKSKFLLYVRNFIFGAEDSLVSTVGLLAGIFAAGVAGRDIIVSGIVLIFVEAFSMSVGSFLSERAVEESEAGFANKKSSSPAAAVIMFFSYFLAGFIPLAPYLFSTGTYSFWGSIMASVLALMLLGFFSARILKTNPWKSTLRMAILGGSAIALGVIVGNIIK